MPQPIPPYLIKDYVDQVHTYAKEITEANSNPASTTPEVFTWMSYAYALDVLAALSGKRLEEVMSEIHTGVARCIVGSSHGRQSETESHATRKFLAKTSAEFLRSKGFAQYQN